MISPLWQFGLGFLVFSVGVVAPPAAAADADVRKDSDRTKAVERLLSVANDLLESAAVSYTYGGSKVGAHADCAACNRCLVKKSPRPGTRLATCPECGECSLDCSHFTHLVYKRALLPYPYLPTASMLSLSPADLKKKYGLLDMGRSPSRAMPGDLLVYEGHVVMLERLHVQKTPGAQELQTVLRGDIIHATGGRDIRAPGQGIQRERQVDLAWFRGPLLRILRHASVYDGSASSTGPLRPVARQR